MRHIRLTFWLTLFPLCLAVISYAQPKPPEWTLSEKLVCNIDTSTWVKESLTISPDSKRVAYAAQAGNKSFVVVDGKNG